MNFFRNAKLVKKDGKYAVELLGKTFVLGEEQQRKLLASGRGEGTVILGIRPVHLHIDENGIPATVDVSEMMGSELHLHMSAGGQDVIAVIPTAGLTFEAVHSGNQIGFAFDPSLVHLFDPETEQNLI